MFICEPCHKKYEKHPWALHIVHSYGPCEYCGKTKKCADCKIPRK